MGGKTATGQSSTTIPPQILANYTTANNKMLAASNSPFQSYSSNPSQFVAQLNAEEKAGMAGAMGAANEAQPYYKDAAAMTQAGSQAANLGSLDPTAYMSPYLNTVASTTEALQNQSNQQQQAGQLGNAITSGAFGGDRAGIAAANLEQQQNLGNSATIANLMNQGYNTSLATAQQQQGAQLGAEQANLARLMQGGQQEAQIGAGAQTSALQGAQAELQAGQLGQQTDQAGLSALYNQFLQEQAYPFQAAQAYANVAEGTGSLSGQTTTSTQPLGLFGGLLSDRRAKENIKKIGKANNGLAIYKFNYKDDPSNVTHVGFMADEVEKKHPDAVGESGGYKTVDYDRATKAYGGGLGVDFDPNAGVYQSGGLNLPGKGGYVPVQQQQQHRMLQPNPSPFTQQQQPLQALAGDISAAKSLYGNAQSAYNWATSANGGRVGYAGGGSPYANEGDDNLVASNENNPSHPGNLLNRVVSLGELTPQQRKLQQAGIIGNPQQGGLGQLASTAAALGTIGSGLGDIASLFAKGGGVRRRKRFDDGGDAGDGTGPGGGPGGPGGAGNGQGPGMGAPGDGTDGGGDTSAVGTVQGVGGFDPGTGVSAAALGIGPVQAFGAPTGTPVAGMRSEQGNFGGLTTATFGGPDQGPADMSGFGSLGPFSSNSQNNPGLALGLAKLGDATGTQQGASLSDPASTYGDLGFSEDINSPAALPSQWSNSINTASNLGLAMGLAQQGNTIGNQEGLALNDPSVTSNNTPSGLTISQLGSMMNSLFGGPASSDASTSTQATAPAPPSKIALRALADNGQPANGPSPAPAISTPQDAPGLEPSIRAMSEAIYGNPAPSPLGQPSDVNADSPPVFAPMSVAQATPSPADIASLSSAMSPSIAAPTPDVTSNPVDVAPISSQPATPPAADDISPITVNAPASIPMPTPRNVAFPGYKSPSLGGSYSPASSLPGRSAGNGMSPAMVKALMIAAQNQNNYATRGRRGYADGGYLGGGPGSLFSDLFGLPAETPAPPPQRADEIQYPPDDSPRRGDELQYPPTGTNAPLPPPRPVSAPVQAAPHVIAAQIPSPAQAPSPGLGGSYQNHLIGRNYSQEWRPDVPPGVIPGTQGTSMVQAPQGGLAPASRQQSAPVPPAMVGSNAWTPPTSSGPRPQAEPDQRNYDMTNNASANQYIRDYAAWKGVDPNLVSGIAKAEGLNAYSAQNPNGASYVDKDAQGRPFSFGDFQLNVRNGLGNAALAAGIDPRDPNQRLAADKFAIDQMAQPNGLRPWAGDAAVRSYQSGQGGAPVSAPQQGGGGLSLGSLFGGSSQPQGQGATYQAGQGERTTMAILSALGAAAQTPGMGPGAMLGAAMRGAGGFGEGYMKQPQEAANIAATQAGAQNTLATAANTQALTGRVGVQTQNDAIEAAKGSIFLPPGGGQPMVVLKDGGYQDLSDWKVNPRGPSAGGALVDQALRAMSPDDVATAARSYNAPSPVAVPPGTPAAGGLPAPGMPAPAAPLPPPLPSLNFGQQSLAAAQGERNQSYLADPTKANSIGIAQQASNEADSARANRQNIALSEQTLADARAGGYQGLFAPEAQNAISASLAGIGRKLGFNDDQMGQIAAAHDINSKIAVFSSLARAKGADQTSLGALDEAIAAMPNTSMQPQAAAQIMASLAQMDRRSIDRSDFIKEYQKNSNGFALNASQAFDNEYQKNYALEHNLLSTMFASKDPNVAKTIHYVNSGVTPEQAQAALQNLFNSKVKSGRSVTIPPNFYRYFPVQGS
jgi:hypothetical protein